MPFQVCKLDGILPIFMHFPPCDKSCSVYCCWILYRSCNVTLSTPENALNPPFLLYFQPFHRHLLQSYRFLVQKWYGRGKGRPWPMVSGHKGESAGGWHRRPARATGRRQGDAVLSLCRLLKKLLLLLKKSY